MEWMTICVGDRKVRPMSFKAKAGQQQSKVASKEEIRPTNQRDWQAARDVMLEHYKGPGYL